MNGPVCKGIARTCLIGFFLVLAGTDTVRAVDCSDSDAALAYWRPIAQQGTDDPARVNELAPKLVACLASPDPELRDRIAYELLTDWLRNGQLDDGTRRELLLSLSGRLDDSDTLSRSFAALVLAEIMRSDTMKPFMTGDEREELLARAARSMHAESDFRGLEPEIGWVHAVAHLADLLWRFALHSGTGDAQAVIILDAVRSKVAPAGAVYATNESDRLARVVSTLIRNQRVDVERMAAWITGFQAPRSMERWSEAFVSPEGMAELHNTKQFLRALSDQLADVEIAPAIGEPLDALIAGFTQLI